MKKYFKLPFYNNGFSTFIFRGSFSTNVSTFHENHTNWPGMYVMNACFYYIFPDASEMSSSKMKVCLILTYFAQRYGCLKMTTP